MNTKDGILYLAQKVGADIGSGGGGGGGTDRGLGITDAAVGDLIMVKTVLNGKPTSWEVISMADLASRILAQMPKWEGGTY